MEGFHIAVWMLLNTVLLEMFFMESFWYENCNIFQYNEVTFRRMVFQLQSSFIYSVGLCVCVNVSAWVCGMPYVPEEVNARRMKF